MVGNVDVVFNCDSISWKIKHFPQDRNAYIDLESQVLHIFKMVASTVIKRLEMKQEKKTQKSRCNSKTYPPITTENIRIQMLNINEATGKKGRCVVFNVQLFENKKIRDKTFWKAMDIFKGLKKISKINKNRHLLVGMDKER